MINKGELIKEGTGSVTKLTNAAHHKTLAFCLVVSMIINIALGLIIWSLTKKVIQTNETLNEKRIEELKEMVHGEVRQQVQPISKQVDTIRQSADSTFNIVKEKVNSIVR